MAAGLHCPELSAPTGLEELQVTLEGTEPLVQERLRPGDQVLCPPEGPSVQTPPQSVRRCRPLRDLAGPWESWARGSASPLCVSLSGTSWLGRAWSQSPWSLPVCAPLLSPSATAAPGAAPAAAVERCALRGQAAEVTLGFLYEANGAFKAHSGWCPHTQGSRRCPA